ncbi:MAG: LacI family transcriptional regulator [Sphaerochaetaceae bacterium]|nr:LacI family transcriptional regulator [Sphaerochaetaceae bacterium]
MKKSNITEVAKKAGVSKTTVSNFLNNKNKKLSQDTKAKIQKVIEELNYVPSISARKLSLKHSSKTIGIVIEHTSIENSLASVISFFSNIFKYVIPLMEENDYKYLIIPDQNLRKETMVDYIKGLCSSNLLDGIMLMNIQENDDYINELKKLNFPFVCFGHTNIKGVDNYIATEHEHSVYKAVNCLLKEDVKDIYCYWTNDSSIVNHQYDYGYRKAFKDKGLDVNNSYILGKNFSSQDSLVGEFKNVLINSEELIGFIIPSSKVDELHEALLETKKELRKDVLLILYAYFPVSEMSERYYSYINTPSKQLGENAFYILQSEMGVLIENRKIKNRFNAELIVNLTSKRKKDN